MTASTSTSRSADRNAKYKLLGALTVGSPGRLPTFSPHPDRNLGCGLILPCDPEHPEYSPTKLWRYKRDNPKIQALMKSILIEGIHPLQAHEIQDRLGKNYLYVSDGGRRGVCLRYLLEDLAANPSLQGVPPNVTVDITFDSSVEAFRRSYRLANIKREDDDPMTTAEKIISALEGDVDVAPCSREQVMEDFEMKEYDINRHIQVYKTGSPRLVEAVARKILPLPQAHVTVGLCPGDHAAQDRYLDWMLSAKEIPSLESLRAMIKGAPTKRQKDAALIKNLLTNSKLPTSSERDVNVEALEDADLEALDEAYREGVFPSQIVRQVLLALKNVDDENINPELRVIMRKVLAKGADVNA
jgi:hypothetical protein